MGGGKELDIRYRMENNNDFFVRYINFLIKKNYIFSKDPKKLISEYNQIIAESAIHKFEFAPFITTFFRYVWENVENKQANDEIEYLWQKSEMIISDKNFKVFNDALNDLYFINPSLSRISYLIICFDFNLNEISDILDLSPSIIRKEFQLSKSFMIGWMIRDKKLEKSILPLLGENRFIDFLEYKDLENLSDLNESAENLEDISQILRELDKEIDGIQFVNSKLSLMDSVLKSKLTT